MLHNSNSNFNTT